MNRPRQIIKVEKQTPTHHPTGKSTAHQPDKYACDADFRFVKIVLPDARLVRPTSGSMIVALLDFARKPAKKMTTARQ